MEDLEDLKSDLDDSQWGLLISIQVVVKFLYADAPFISVDINSFDIVQNFHYVALSSLENIHVTQV